MPVLGLAGRHWRKWKLVQVHGGDQSPLPPLWNSFVGTGIHNGPVPPANLMLKQEKREQPKEVLHLCRWSTHTPRCREAFAQIRKRCMLLSDPWSGNGFKIQGRIINWINPKAHRPSSGNASMRRAWFDKVLVDSAKWRKVSQICRREDLNWVSGKVIFSILETFEYGHIGLPVIVENVPEERCQLVNLDRRWSNVNIGNDRISVIHAGFMHRSRAFWSFILMGMPISIRRDLRNLKIATPVVGELGGLIPWVNPAILAGTNVADDAIEKVLRLPIVMVATPIHFRHHKSAKCRLGVVIWRWLDLDKVVCMELTSDFCHLVLEWIGFSCKIGETWSLMIGRRWYGCGKVCRRVPVVRCVLTWSCRWDRRSSLGSSVTARWMQWIRRSSSATGLPMIARSPWKTTWHAHGRWRIRDTGKWGITLGHGTAGAKCWRIYQVRKNPRSDKTWRSKTQGKGLFKLKEACCDWARPRGNSCARWKAPGET